MFSQLFTDIGTLLERYGQAYFQGMLNTLGLALISTFFGCAIGFLCGILQTIPYQKTDNIFKRFFLKLIRAVIRVYVEVFRGTPMVLQAVFIYYGLPYFSGGALRFTNVWLAAIIVVSVNTGAYMAETVRGGVISIDPGQTEGAKSIGMSHFQTMIHVILPQAIRNIIPQIGNNYIINLKDTSVMFIISFTEFFAAHRAAVGATYLYFPSATIEMLGYLTMTILASVILRLVEKKLAGSKNYKLVQEDSLTLSAGTYTRSSKDSTFNERNLEIDSTEGGR